MFFKIGVLKNFANFTGKQLSWSLSSIKLKVLKPVTLLKIDSNTCVSSEIYEIFKNIVFYRTHPMAASE